MKPALPETAALEELLSKSVEELADEIEVAKRFLALADTYLAWAQMGQQLVAQWEAVRGADYREPDGYIYREGLRRITVLRAPRQENGRPSLRQAILATMGASPPGTVWKKSQIFKALKDTGWEPRGQKPSAQLATRLAEMIERGEIERVSVGHYRLKRDQQELPAAAVQGAEEG